MPRKWDSLPGFLVLLVSIGLVSKATAPAPAAGEKTAEKGKAAPKIQMAILLDTSGSMRGDGSVHQLRGDITAKTALHLFQMNDGNSVNYNQIH